MLKTRDRRALIAGGTLIAAALVLTFVVLPSVRSFSTARQELSMERSLLDREIRAVAQAGDAAKALRLAEGELGRLATASFDGSEPALATGELARHVEAIGALTGVTPLHIEPLGAQGGTSGTSRVRIRTAGTTTYGSLIVLLHRIETAPVPMSIEQFAVRLSDGVPEDEDVEPLLAFTLVVQALALEDRARIATFDRADHAQHTSGDELVSEAAIIASLTDDPFQPGVNVPGRTPSFAATKTGPVTPPGSIRLVGTVALPENRSVVMAQWGTEPARIVRIGEQIGALVLRRVEPGSAEFEDESGSRLTVRVPKPGA
jgi:hypothetical protein